MNRRIPLSRKEINVICNALEEKKREKYLPPSLAEEIGIDFIQKLIDKLLKGTDGNISVGGSNG
jgi:hypothetical protein